MEPDNEIEFRVDEQYENEKGLFTVIAIHRDEMVIRWENGEEIQTDIELQRNIQTRRRWEKARRAEKTKASQKGSAKSNQDAQAFDGFQASDFKSTAAGTKWRGRNQLGRPVARKLAAEGLGFNSWAISNKSEVHWLDRERRQLMGADASARFFVRLDKKELMYGLCVPRPKGPAVAPPDWEVFSKWFARDENQRRVQILAAENELAIYDQARPALALVPFEGGWHLHEGNLQQIDQKAAAFMAGVPDTGTASLEVARKVEKSAAVARGKDIVEDISALFLLLMPLYRAATMGYGVV